MKLDRETYGPLRAEMRQQLIKASRIGIHEEHRVLRRISRLDMCYLRGLDWNDFTPGDIIAAPAYTTETGDETA